MKTIVKKSIAYLTLCTASIVTAYAAEVLMPTDVLDRSVAWPTRSHYIPTFGSPIHQSKSAYAQEDFDLQRAITESLQTYSYHQKALQQEETDLQQAIAESLKEQYKVTPIKTESKPLEQPQPSADFLTERLKDAQAKGWFDTGEKNLSKIAQMLLGNETIVYRTTDRAAETQKAQNKYANHFKAQGIKAINLPHMEALNNELLARFNKNSDKVHEPVAQVEVTHKTSVEEQKPIKSHEIFNQGTAVEKIKALINAGWLEMRQENINTLASILLSSGVIDKRIINTADVSNRIQKIAIQQYKGKGLKIDPKVQLNLKEELDRKLAGRKIEAIDFSANPIATTKSPVITPINDVKKPTTAQFSKLDKPVKEDELAIQPNQSPKFLIQRFVKPFINAAQKTLSEIKNPKLKEQISQLTPDQVIYKKVRSGGGTQTVNYILCKDFFLQAFKNPYDLKERQAAEQEIARRLNPALQSAFVQSIETLNRFALVDEKGVVTARGAMIYPYIQGKDFCDSLQKDKYKKLGKILGEIHQETFDSRLNAALLYDDFQSSNVMVTAAGEIKFIDYGGLKMMSLDNIAKHIKDFLNGSSKESKSAFIKAYTKMFPAMGRYFK